MAVLAFDNLSGDPAQDYFSDGIAEEILTALARSPRLTVIARNSSFAYKGKPAGALEIGEALGVRYLLEGSVKRGGDRIRVTAQLVDARTGGHVWAEQYDRPLGDIFAVQDEVTAAIAARLGATIERAEADLARRKAPADLGAYDYYLQGRVKRVASDKAPQLEARELFRKAVALDPGFASAYAELAHSDYTEVALRWDPPRREEALTEGFALARKAIELDPELPLAHLTMGNLHLRRHDYDEAAGWAERAVALGPSDPENYVGLANIYSFMGRAAEALALMRKAVELDPAYPPRYGMYLGRAYLFTRRPEAAVPHLRDAASRAPDYWPAHLFLAAAYGHLGLPDEAAAALAAVRRQVRLASLRDADPADDYRAGPERDYYLEGLALAGLPRE
jgi:TolB-like protein/Tfp pilus assembly protein PilF